MSPAEDRKPTGPGDGGKRHAAESLAYTIMGGVALGAGIGVGLDLLLGTLPVFLAIGMFAGLAFALYVTYLRVR
jgi:F0F1-type ATP synthase assembly protein I